MCSGSGEYFAVLLHGRCGEEIEQTDIYAALVKTLEFARSTGPPLGIVHVLVCTLRSWACRKAPLPVCSERTLLFRGCRSGLIEVLNRSPAV